MNEQELKERMHEAIDRMSVAEIVLLVVLLQLVKVQLLLRGGDRKLLAAEAEPQEPQGSPPADVSSTIETIRAIIEQQNERLEHGPLRLAGQRQINPRERRQGWWVDSSGEPHPPWIEPWQVEATEPQDAVAAAWARREYDAYLSYIDRQRELEIDRLEELRHNIQRKIYEMDTALINQDCSARPPESISVSTVMETMARRSKLQNQLDSVYEQLRSFSSSYAVGPCTPDRNQITNRNQTPRVRIGPAAYGSLCGFTTIAGAGPEENGTATNPETV